MTKQMTHFRNRQGKQGSRVRSRIKSRRSLDGKERRDQGDVLGTDPARECMRQHHQLDMTIPSNEAADLVVVQAQIFGRFKVFFNMPAGADGFHHLWQRGSWWPKDEGVGLLLWIGEAPAYEQPVSSILFPPVQHRDARPVKKPRTFRPLTHRETLPVLVMQQERFHFTHFHPSASSIRSHDANRLITSHSHHIVVMVLLTPGAQVQIAAIHRIGHHPGNLDLRCPEALHHLDRQFWFGLEAHRLRNTCFSAPLLIRAPIERKVEFAVNEGMATSRHVGQKDTDLTVLHLPRGPAVLYLDPGRLLPAFGETGFINNQDGGLLPEVFQDILAQVVTHAVSIPDRLGEQALHTIGPGFSGLLGQVPAIFALTATQQALQVCQGPTTGFWSDKARGNPGMQLGEHARPVRHLGWGRLGSGEGDMLGLFHDLLLSGVSSAVGIRTNRVSHLQGKIVKRFSADLKKVITQFRKCNCSVPWPATTHPELPDTFPPPGSSVTPLKSTGSVGVTETAALAQQLARLERSVTTIQEQMSALVLEVAREQQRSAEQRLNMLEALVQHLLGSAPLPPVVQQTSELNLAEATPGPGRRLLPAEVRARSRVTPLIEYGAQGGYVLVCPREGTLQFAPDSAQWFDWLASLISFRLVGQQGRFSAHRDTERGQRTRAGAPIAPSISTPTSITWAPPIT